jgi:nitroimidazol reductase NimA-like FMN-containing flavoprotein (pyridoxamine 5'-phosphate oxidase superfamily)
MNTANRPRIRELTREECEGILARNRVGRLAYSRQNRVDIEPLHYVFHDGWLYGRTSHGAKLVATGYEWWPVAFEVDEVEDVFQWRSVVVHGGFYVVDEYGPDWESAQWRQGVELLRQIVPETFADGDPVPHRRVVFRIALQEVTGREAEPAGGAGG